MAIKLSICIPAYNRAAFLGETLESVIGQASEEVEVVVSDNASTDNTAEVVQAYQARFPRLTYFRQPANLGADRNYLKTVELARGEYCWLLGSDDVLKEGAIRTLIDGHLTRTPSPDFVLLTGTVYDHSLTRVLLESADELGITEDIETRDVLWFFENFFRESGLSVYVVKRERWNSVDPEPYVGTGLVYLGVVYEYLGLDSPVQIVARPSIKYRSGNASWSKDTLDIVVGRMNYVMARLPARFDPAKPEAMRLFRERVPVTLKMLSSLRSEGSYNLGLYRKHLLSYFRGNAFATAAALLIALSPPLLFQALRALHRARRRDEHG